MESSWKLTVQALGTAAGELADTGQGQAQSMLAALGGELVALAAPAAADGTRGAARALLLTAERAAKVAAMLPGVVAGGDARLRAAAASAAHLAHASALGARARAEPLLAQLPDGELRANFEAEFAAHAQQAAELAAQAK